MGTTLQISHTFDEEDRDLEDFDSDQYSLEEWFMLSEYFDKGSVEVTVIGDMVNFDIQQLGVNVRSVQTPYPKGNLDCTESDDKLVFSRKPRAKSQDK